MFWYTRSADKKINSGAHCMADGRALTFRCNVFCWCIYRYLGCKTWLPDPGSDCQCCNLCTDRKASVDIFRDAIDKMVDHSCDEATEESMREVIMGVKGVKESTFSRHDYSVLRCMWILKFQQMVRFH